MIPFGTNVSKQGATGIEVTLTRMDDKVAADLADRFSQMSPWSHYPFTPDDLARYFATEEAGAPRYAVRLTSEPDAAIGALGLRENWLRGPYIQFLGLTEVFQSRSIGKALLCQVKTTAHQDGAQNLWAMASQFNKRAIAFYRRFGFFPVADIDALVTPDQSEVLLRKRLG